MEVFYPSADEWRVVSGGAVPRSYRDRGTSVVTLNNRVLLLGEKITLSG